MEHVRWTARPALRSPVLVAAFTGWNDAGDAASTAVRHLVDVWHAELIATIDPEEFYDFQSTRPEVKLIDGETREISWPSNEIYAASTPGADVLLLVGTEPQLRWRTFCRQITDIAAEYRVRMTLTLGTLLADVAHSRPVSLIGTASDQDTIDRFGLARSRYEGPTGVVGVLQHTCAEAGLASASLWAAVPAYAASVPSPKAALALVERAAAFVGTPAGAGALEEAGTEYEREVDELVASDDDLSGYVRRIETFASDDDDEDSDDDLHVTPPPADADPAQAARLVEDIERFLRDHKPD